MLETTKYMSVLQGVQPFETFKIKDKKDFLENGEELMRIKIFGLGLVKALYTQVTLHNRHNLKLGVNVHLF